MYVGGAFIWGGGGLYYQHMAEPGAFIWEGRLFKGGAFIRTNTVCFE